MGFYFILKTRYWQKKSLYFFFFFVERHFKFMFAVIYIYIYTHSKQLCLLFYFRLWILHLCVPWMYSDLNEMLLLCSFIQAPTATL